VEGVAIRRFDGASRSAFASTDDPGSGHAWAIVLAAGEGTRLSGLTADETGSPVPKQYCSLDGRTSLLALALKRATAVVPDRRTTCIVSPRHARFWQPALATLIAGNIVVQPAKRGTGIGMLLPALRIAKCDPDARIVILPSDHYVADERVLETALRQALNDIRDNTRGVALLGVEADEPDSELGYVVPTGRTRSIFQDVQRFVEKPSLAEAQRLCEDGALWNSFIVVCRVRSLIDLFMPRCAEIVEILLDADVGDYQALSEVYDALPAVDFSNDIATGQERCLSVLSVPRCGWNDLGTPRRLAQTLVRHEKQALPAAESCAGGGTINLAERLLQVHPGLLTGATHHARRSSSERMGGEIREPLHAIAHAS